MTCQIIYNRIERIQGATREDQILKLLIQQIMDSWPQHCKSLPVALYLLWQMKNDLAACIIYEVFGIPKEIISDYGSKFIA